MPGLLLGAMFLLGVWAGQTWSSKIRWQAGVLQGYTYASKPDSQSPDVRADVSAVLCDHGLIRKRESVWTVDV